MIKYVNSETGSDSNNGNASTTPYLTMEKALDNVDTGDTLIVASVDKSYKLVNTDKDLPHNLTIKGTLFPGLVASPAATIDASLLAARAWYTKGSVTLENLVIKNFTTYSGRYPFININTNMTAVDAVITLNRCMVIDAVVGTSTSSRGGFLGNNNQNNNSPALSTTINLNECAFSNIKAETNSTTTSLCRLGNAGSVATLNTRNCTYYATASGYGIRYLASAYNGADAIDFINHKNLLILNENADTLALGYAHVESCDGGGYTGNINQVANTTNFTNYPDPRFVDKTSNIFHLRPDSPAINGGQY